MFTFLSIILFGLLCSNTRAEFYHPNCEYAGMSCLDCYTQKLCLNFWGLIHWSDTSCVNDVAGYSNPYCNPETNKCTNVPPTGCPALHRCLKNTVYPDYNDCSSYYQCINSVPESVTCPKDYIYKQEYGKCVFKLSEKDCIAIEACGLRDYIALYPGDPSIYYGCLSSKFYIEACSDSETYNIEANRCESRCTSVKSFAVSQNCTKYYTCTETDSGFVAVEQSCAVGYGFNPNTLTCEVNYDTLCNELTLVENDLNDLVLKVPILGKLISFVKSILNFLHLNPTKLILKYIPSGTLSKYILILDYVYWNKLLPPTVIAIIIDYAVKFLPPEIQFALMILRQFGILNFRAASTEPANVLTTNVSLEDQLQDVLANVKIDLVSIIQGFEDKNATQVSAEIFQQIVKILGIPKQNVALLATLKNQMPVLADFLNNYFGRTVFVVERNGSLKLNVNDIDQAVNEILNFIPEKLYPNNYLVAELYKMSLRQQYYAHRDEVVNFANNFYFTLDSI